VSRFGKTRLIWGAAKRRRWRVVRLIVYLTVQGLIRRTCLSCGRKKGFTSSRFCSQCQYDSLMRALYED